MIKSRTASFNKSVEYKSSMISKKLLLSLLGVALAFAAAFAAMELFSSDDIEKESDGADVVASDTEETDPDVLGNNDEQEPSEINSDDNSDRNSSEDEQEVIEVPEELQGDLRYDPEAQKSFIDKLNEKNSEEGDE